MVKSKELDFAKSKFLESDFFRSKAWTNLFYWSNIFIKSFIFYYFVSKHYIWIDINTLGYIIGSILSQIIQNQLFPKYITFKNPDPNFFKSENHKWYPKLFFSRKMILKKIKYKIHNQELLAIIKVFNTWCQYLEDYKYNVLFLNNHNIDW